LDLRLWIAYPYIPGINGCDRDGFVCIVDSMYMIFQADLGMEGRAKLTLPKGLSLSNSKIKGAGKGVWTDTKIAKSVRFGPYEGISKPCNDVKEDQVSGYGWLVSSSGLV